MQSFFLLMLFLVTIQKQLEITLGYLPLVLTIYL